MLLLLLQLQAGCAGVVQVLKGAAAVAGIVAGAGAAAAWGECKGAEDSQAEEVKYLQCNLRLPA